MQAVTIIVVGQVQRISLSKINRTSDEIVTNRILRAHSKYARNNLLYMRLCLHFWDALTGQNSIRARSKELVGMAHITAKPSEI